MNFSITSAQDYDDEQIAAYGSAVAALRRLQDAVVGAVPDTGSLHVLAKSLDEITATLAEHAVDEDHQIAGKAPQLPLRGLPIQPAMVTDHRDRDEIRGHLVLTRFFLGAGAAAHGGVPPLIFDQLMGELASTDRSICRTASLTTNYRAVTPMGVRLDIRLWVEREEGRKRYLRGEIRHGETLCVEVEGLFIGLRGL